jgi:hypothetical protein
VSPAKLSDDLVVGTFNDWFLPSVTELFLMYFNLQEQNLGNFSGEYWSSTDGHLNPFYQLGPFSQKTAWAVRFTTGVGPAGDTWQNFKSYLANTRAVRYF